MPNNREATTLKQSASNELLCVLVDQCREELAAQETDFYRNHIKRGDKVAVNIGPLTVSIANAAGKTTANCRRLLDGLEKAGKVISLRSPGCISRWWPVGLAEELNA